MTIDEITWISFILSIIGILFSGVALILQYRDKPRIKIIQIRPALAGSMDSAGQQWKHKVISIEVKVENKGSRAITECEGIITFPFDEALPLYPVTREHKIDLNRSFSIQSNSKMNLVAAWKINNGIIDGTTSLQSPGEFIQKCIPATVILKYGNKNSKKVLNRKKTRDIFEKQQIQTYLN